MSFCNPSILKRLVKNITTSIQDLILNKTNNRNYKKYVEFYEIFEKLHEEDVIKIIKHVEASQTRSIIKAMERKKSYIYVNKLGVFYIKPTTHVYYNTIRELTEGKDESEINYDEVIQEALNKSKEIHIFRAGNKGYGNKTREIQGLHSEE